MMKLLSPTMGLEHTSIFPTKGRMHLADQLPPKSSRRRKPRLHMTPHVAAGLSCLLRLMSSRPKLNLPSISSLVHFSELHPATLVPIAQ
jgi:hypothetical protein